MTEQQQQQQQQQHQPQQHQPQERQVQFDKLVELVDQVLAVLRAQPLVTSPILERSSSWGGWNGGGPACKSFLDHVPPHLQRELLQTARALLATLEQQPPSSFQPEHDMALQLRIISRSIGCMQGMAIADGLGHFFEFVAACDEVGGRDHDGPRLEYGPRHDSHDDDDDKSKENTTTTQTTKDSKNDANEEEEEEESSDHSDDSQNTLTAYGYHNQFCLKVGQWTDDASMGLCLADSLLAKDDFDGSHCRALFFNWWNNGFNNAFKYDKDRPIKSSVGLGGNISNSLAAMNRHCQPTVQLGGGGTSLLWQSNHSNYYHGSTLFGSDNNEIQHDEDDGQHYNNNNNLYHYKSIPPRFEPTSSDQQEDAGNGSLMRLAAIPIFFAATTTVKNDNNDPAMVQEMAYESSLTTHAGPLAAEACAFMASLIVACLNRRLTGSDGRSDVSSHTGDSEAKLKQSDCNKSSEKAYPAKAFLDAFCQEYQQQLETIIQQQADTLQPSQLAAKQALSRLLASSEPHTSNERCWNWKNPLVEDCDTATTDEATVGLGIEQTLKNRGASYNGYPVSDTYFGSFSLDALAMALHCVRNTSSFSEAIVRCINFLGDADTTGSICGQIAGAFYGHASIPRKWKQKLEKWDGEGFELRAVCLAVRGQQKYLSSSSTTLMNEEGEGEDSMDIGDTGI